MGLTMQFKLIVFYINICGFVSHEYIAVGIFCYSSNALSTFVYGINLVQTVVTIFVIQYGSCPASWILCDVIYAQRHNGSDEGISNLNLVRLNLLLQKL